MTTDSPTLPKGWESKTIREATKLVTRGTAPSYVADSLVSAIGQRCIQNAGFNVNATRPHDPKLLKHAIRPAVGDVLLNSTGTGTIGRSCIFDQEVGCFVIDSHVTLLRPRSGILESRFLQAVLQSSWVQRFLENYCYSGSTNQVELVGSRLESMVMPLPTIREQRRIAEILDATDSRIESANLELAKRRTLADAMMRALLNSIEPSKMLSVGNCYSIATGLTLAPYRQALTQAAPYLRVANVQRGRLDLTDITVTGIQPIERDRYSLQAGDLLIVEGHADPDQIGRCAQVNDAASGFLYQNHLFRLRSSNIAPEFGLAWLNSDTARAYWRENCATSSGLYTINGPTLAQMPLPLVSDEDQKQIVTLARTSKEAVEASVDMPRKLRRVQKGLMDDLLTGRVRVSDCQHT